MPYLGALISDPLAASDGDAWVRVDLAHPEFRVWMNGAAVTLATAGEVVDLNATVTAHIGATTNVHGIADTSALVTTPAMTTAIATAVDAHNAATTNVHGIADTTELVTTPAMTTAIATAVDAHSAVTTNVHGIADTAELVTNAGLQTALDTHSAVTTNVHGIADTAELVTNAGLQTALDTHSAVTTNVHGIADTAELVTTPAMDAALTAAVNAYNAVTTNVHGIADTAELVTGTEMNTAVATALDEHNITTAGVHGIVDVTDLVTTGLMQTAINAAVGGHKNATNSVHGITDTTLLVTTPAMDTAIAAVVDAHNAAAEGVHGLPATSSVVGYDTVERMVTLPDGGNIVLTPDAGEGGNITAAGGEFSELLVSNTVQMNAGAHISDEGQGFTWATGPGYGKYRQFVGHLTPTNPLYPETDWQYRIGSYNWLWDKTTGGSVKDVPGDAAFQMVFESSWENLFEWNFDLSTRSDNLGHRRLGFFYNKDTASALWQLSTTDGIALNLGGGDEAQLSWQSTTAVSKTMLMQAKSNNNAHAVVRAVNGAGNYLASQISGATTNGSNYAGLGDVNVALLHSNVPMLVGPFTASALNLMTAGTLRGGITSGGVWCLGSMATTDAAAGELVLQAGKRITSRTSNAAVSAPLIGLDTSDRTALYLQSKPLNLQSPSTATTAGAALGYIKAVIGGTTVKIPYFADV
ncbi:MAG TPA: hypothetical protein VFJ16_06015 [Longimicrobium sp.]|nr:hypothetical protein [Longimicrobium sp.]